MRETRRTDQSRLGEMLGEIVDFSAGVRLGIMLLPLFATALPRVLLLLVLPAMLNARRGGRPRRGRRGDPRALYLLVRFVGRLRGAR